MSSGRRAGSGLEGAPVGGRRRRRGAAEMGAQRGRVAEADLAGDLLDRQVGLLEQAAGGEDAAAEHPLQRRRPGLGAGAGGGWVGGGVGWRGWAVARSAGDPGGPIGGPRGLPLKRAEIGLTRPADRLGRAEELRLAA